MLKRIECVEGIGLLHEARGPSHELKKATFIYADNGRGKTTLSSIFQSLSKNNASLIADRKTIDGTLPPKITFQFDSGHKVNFNNGSWSEQRPELLVFDADFIERNVHSGGTVNTGHRKNLLDFALGESAVIAKKEVEKATGESKIASDKVTSLSNQLSGHHVGITLAQFEKIQKIDDVEKKLAEMQARISASNNITSILNKALPSAIQKPVLDIDYLFDVLSISLQDVHADAEKIVRRHIDMLNSKLAENWLSQGRQFDDKKTCPYCAQSTADIELIGAYQTHFNSSYNELKSKVESQIAIVTNNTSSSVIEKFRQAVNAAIAHANSWSEQISSQPIIFNHDSANDILLELQILLLDLLKRKKASPAESLGTSQEKECNVPIFSTKTPFQIDRQQSL